MSARMPYCVHTMCGITGYIGQKEATEIIFDRAVDIFFYEVLPNVWHEHIVPFYRRTKEALTSKELKADAVLAQKKASVPATTKPKAATKMTQEEADVEKR
ncbi:MAG: hypothetical protein EGQ82_02995, partial [Clostridiales bacterium]|nr:hypothetical protein [Clostridiales bacterium]